MILGGALAAKIIDIDRQQGADGAGEQQAPGKFRATRSEGSSVQAYGRKGCSWGEAQGELQGEKRLVSAFVKQSTSFILLVFIRIC